MKHLGYYVRWNGDCRDDYYPAGCHQYAQARVKELKEQGFPDARLHKEFRVNRGIDRFGNKK